MYCVNCRAQIDPATVFCPFCGIKQHSVQEQTVPIRPQAQPPTGYSVPPPAAPLPQQAAPMGIRQPSPGANQPIPPVRNPMPSPGANRQIPPVGNPMPSPVSGIQSAAPGIKLPAAGENSVFDFSMMNVPAAIPTAEPASTTMTPQQRRAVKKSSSGKAGKIVAAIVSGVAVIAAAAALFIFMVLPGIQVDRSLAKAQEYMDSGSYELAEEEYGKVIAADPDNVEAYSGKADALEEQGKLSEAAEVLREGYKRTSSYLLSSRCDEIEAELYGG